MQMQGTVAIVTGGTRGLGRAIAEEFVREGATVIGASRTGGQSAALAPEAGAGRLVFDSVDVCKPASVADLVARTVNAFGRLDVLVANAGISIDGRVDTLPVEDFDRVVLTNLSGTYYSIRAAVPQMRAQGGGRIITMSSVLAGRPVIGASAYSATKAAIQTLTSVAAIELAPDGIAVNCLAPGFTATGMGEQVASNPRLWAAYQKRIAIGRLAAPREIARQALWLATTDPYVTGQVLEVTGGLSWA